MLSRPEWTFLTGLCQQEEYVAAPQIRRLYEGADLPGLLRLSQEQIDWLVGTRQLQPLRICGEVRYDSRQIDDLINTYLITASKRAQ